MFYSSDQRCIVKTTTMEESATLNSIMPVYVKHLEENPNSLLVRFLGSHCITMYGVEIYFVVMLNVFPSFQLSERYDLKGSWVNRHGFHGSRKTRLERKKREQSSAPLFQDNDLQNTISIESEVAHALALQIRADIRFLQGIATLLACACLCAIPSNLVCLSIGLSVSVCVCVAANNFMDYSLLIGVRRERFRVVPSAAAAASTVRASEFASNGSLLAASLDDEEKSAADADGFGSSVDRWRLLSRGAEDTLKRDLHGGIRAEMVEGPGTYYMGIIDVLQRWTWIKRLERFFKVYVKLLDGEGLSAVSPTPYCQR